MRKADNLPPSCAVVTKNGYLSFLGPSGPVQACNGTALPLPCIKEMMMMMMMMMIIIIIIIITTAFM